MYEFVSGDDNKETDFPFHNIEINRCCGCREASHISRKLIFISRIQVALLFHFSHSWYLGNEAERKPGPVLRMTARCVWKQFADIFIPWLFCIEHEGRLPYCGPPISQVQKKKKVSGSSRLHCSFFSFPFILCAFVWRKIFFFNSLFGQC